MNIIVIIIIPTSQCLALLPPSARCAYAADVLAQDLDIVAVGAVSLYRIL
jgi:hypothetical protein